MLSRSDWHVARLLTLGNELGVRAHLRVLITSNWTREEIDRAFRQAGATDADIDAFYERVKVVDRYAMGVRKRPRSDRVDLDPARVEDLRRGAGGGGRVVSRCRYKRPCTDSGCNCRFCFAPFYHARLRAT